MTIRPAQRILLKDQVYLSLREAIVAGDLAPGTQLREEDLASGLGVSKAPVRDAIARLVADGLVESRPQRWTRVTPIVDGVVRDAVLVVRAMHELAVREAAPRLTTVDLVEMAAANRAFEAALAIGDIDAALSADDAFHDVPVRASANRAAAATIDRFTPMIRRLERLRFSAPDARRSARLHRRLLAALRRGDAETAVALTTSIWSALERDIHDPLPSLGSPARKAAP